MIRAGCCVLLPLLLAIFAASWIKRNYPERWYAFPRQPQAIAELRIGPSFMARSSPAVSTAVARDEFRQKKTQLVALLRSREFLTAVVRRREVASLEMIRRRPDAAEWLESVLRVSEPAIEFLRVSLDVRESTESATLVNAIVNAAIEEQATIEFDALRRRYRELEQAEVELEARRQMGRNTPEGSAIESGPTDESDAVGTDIRVERELDEVRKKLLELRIERSYQPGLMLHRPAEYNEQ
jgi:hypothetical protein